MARSGLGLQQLWPDVEWGPVELTLPQVTFNDRLTLHTGSAEVRLMHLGPAHTTGDVVAWLPESRVLFAGDIVMNGATPFCLMGSVSGSLRAIDRLRALDPVTVVPGHGMSGGPEILDDCARYLRWIQHLAADALAHGLTPLEAARETGLGEWAGLLDSERLVPNLFRAGAEARGCLPGEQLDEMAAFAEMIEFHGGLPACHA
jgi:cyclase